MSLNYANLVFFLDLLLIKIIKYFLCILNIFKQYIKIIEKYFLFNNREYIFNLTIILLN